MRCCFCRYVCAVRGVVVGWGWLLFRSVSRFVGVGSVGMGSITGFFLREAAVDEAG